MFSVMYTGMNLLPLCTAIVCPTKSGEIVHDLASRRQDDRHAVRRVSKESGADHLGARRNVDQSTAAIGVGQGFEGGAFDADRRAIQGATGLGIEHQARDDHGVQYG